ncbi:MAG: LysR family transcriptional regulator [Elainellaceae cyanobacterium]
MRLEQLQAFLAVVDSKSFQQAARKLGITQSTVSRQVQNLEAELGVSLFHRSSQTKLTVAGDRFFLRARRICQEWTQATTELADLMAGKQTELCIAAIHSVCAHYLPPVLQQFCQDYPDVQLRVTSLGSDRALKVLRDGLVDLAIVMNNRFLTSSGDMVVDVLYEEPIEVLLAANHPLTQQTHISWAELARYPHVVFKDGYGMQRLVQEQFQRQGLSFQAIMELNTLDAFRGIVRQGTTVALLPRSTFLDIRHDPTLAIRPTHPPSLNREVVVVTTCDRLNIPPIQRFYELVHSLLTTNREATLGPDLVSLVG